MDRHWSVLASGHSSDIPHIATLVASDNPPVEEDGRVKPVSAGHG
jgi:hypothetical protein